MNAAGDCLDLYVADKSAVLNGKLSALMAHQLRKTALKADGPDGCVLRLLSALACLFAAVCCCTRLWLSLLKHHERCCAELCTLAET